MPESGYGATRIVVVLDDGTRISDVHVAWGKEIVKVGQGFDVPFDVSRVVDVEFQNRSEPASMTKALTLRSIELRTPILHSCKVIQTLHEGGGPAKLLVEIDPPAPGEPYRRSGAFSRLVLAPRHKGATLAPQVSEWPFHVHMCAPEAGGTWSEGPFEILDWGLLEEASCEGT